MASIIKVDRILDSTELGKVDIPGGVETTELIADTWKNVDGTENYKCRSWVNFDGTTTPPTIRASGNVSSVVRNGTGEYTVNFTEAMPDVNYATIVTSTRHPGVVIDVGRNTSSVRVGARTSNDAAYESIDISVTVHR